jgi:hypothetical protein
MKQYRDTVRTGGFICSTIVESAPVTVPTVYIANRFIHKLSAKCQFDFERTHLNKGSELLFQNASYFCVYNEKKNDSDCNFLYEPDVITHLGFTGKPNESDLVYYLRSQPCSNIID